MQTLREKRFFIVRTKTSSSTLSHLKADTVYSFEIRARTAAGYGRYSEPVDINMAMPGKYYPEGMTLAKWHAHTVNSIIVVIPGRFSYIMHRGTQQLSPHHLNLSMPPHSQSHCSGKQCEPRRCACRVRGNNSCHCHRNLCVYPEKVCLNVCVSITQLMQNLSLNIET